MGSILRATLILGSGSVVSLFAGFIANKAYAIWVGPEGLGLLSLLQGLLGLAALVAGMGLPSGLVRLGATAASQNDSTFIAALRQASWQLYALIAGTVVLLSLLFGQPIARLMLADSPASILVWVVLAVLLSLAAGLQIGLLNAYHRVEMLARVTALSSIFGAVWGVGLVWLWREAALPWVLLGAPVAQLILSSYFVRSLHLPIEKPAPAKVRDARARLLRFGFPYTLSQLVGSAVQLAMPFFVLHQLGQENVGYYRAAVLFSTAYIGFLLNALGQDYYPRLSSVRDQPEVFRQTIHLQQKFVLLIGSPLIALSMALAPPMVTILFSAEFEPAVKVLQWQLLGDLLRFLSWTLGFAVLAILPSRTYLFTETLGGGMMLGFCLWGMQQFGLQGLGIGWLLGYGGYLLVLALVLVASKTWAPTWSNVGLLMLGLGVAILVRVFSQPWGLLVALVWTMMCGFWLLVRLRWVRVEVR